MDRTDSAQSKTRVIQTKGSDITGTKRTIEDVRIKAAELGYTVLSKDYVRATSALLFYCPKHGEFKKTFKAMLKGQGCQSCALENRAAKRRLSYDYVKQMVELAGYKLLDDNYKNDVTPMKMICPKHGIIFLNFDRIRDGHGCQQCANESRSKSNRNSMVYVRDKVKDLGYELVSKDYNGCDSNIVVKCQKHGEFTSTLHLLESGALCPECSYENEVFSHSGCRNYSWKGGVSKLAHYARKFLDSWRDEEFKKANYRCQITGLTGTLNVHHMVSFSSILSKSIDDVGLEVGSYIGDYDEKDLEKIVNRVVKNNEEMAHPIVMLEEVHKKFHQFCGGTTKPTSFEQLEEFKQAIDDGLVVINTSNGGDNNG